MYCWRDLAAGGGLVSYGGQHCRRRSPARHLCRKDPKGAPSPPICRSRNRPNSSWSSTSRPPRRSA
jgi:hypothetical protein